MKDAPGPVRILWELLVIVGGLVAFWYWAISALVAWMSSSGQA